MRLRSLNKNGFSLAGILVGMALLGILTIGMMEMFSGMLKGQNYNKFRTQVENFGEELRSQLGISAICTATFSTTQLDPNTSVTIPLIKDAAGNAIYKVNTSYGDNSFKITSMDLKSSPTQPWYTEDNPATSSGRMILTVNYHALAQQAGPADFFRTYTIATHHDPQKKLTDCAALAKMSDGIWRYNSTTLADIYYTGGNVGIGTSAPTATLEVNGPVKFGTSTDTCGSALEGQQRYNYTTHLMEFCNGTDWTAYGTGAAGNAQIFDASGTWTKPSSGTVVQVDCWGAGGGGGGAVVGAFGPLWCHGNGGGGGAFNTKQFLLTAVPATVQVTIGIGGVGKSGVRTAGNGGPSSFGSLLVANGGTGGSGTSGAGADPDIVGQGGVSPAFSGNGGGGGSAYCGGGPGGDAQNGGGGGGGYMSGGQGCAGGGGLGGSSAAGGAGGNAGATPTSGGIPGGGGGGGALGITGGNGGNGRCIIKVL